MTKFNLIFSSKHKCFMWVSKRKKATRKFFYDTKTKNKVQGEYDEVSVTNQDDDNDEFQDEIVCFKVPRLWEQE